MGRLEDIATAISNMKGTKNKDLVATAEALRRLKKEADLDTNQKLGAILGHSGEMVRQFLAILEFEDDQEVMNLFRSRKLGLEQGRRLKQLKARFPNDTVLPRRAAIAMESLTAHQSRELVDYLISHPEETVEIATDKVLSSQIQPRGQHAIVAIIDPMRYQQLAAQSRKRRVPRDVLVTQAVIEWLEKQTPDAS